MIFETAGFRAAFAVSAIVGALAILVLKKYCLPDEAPGAEEEKESETDQREALKDGRKSSR
jgi:predicted MFS family arabinose efflux permease